MAREPRLTASWLTSCPAHSTVTASATAMAMGVGGIAAPAPADGEAEPGRCNRRSSAWMPPAVRTAAPAATECARRPSRRAAPAATSCARFPSRYFITSRKRQRPPQGLLSKPELPYSG